MYYNDYLATLKVPCSFHGGPLDGQTHERVPWPRFEVLVSDPLPEGGPREGVPFAIAYYEPDPEIMTTARVIPYVYRGEE